MLTCRSSVVLQIDAVVGGTARKEGRARCIDPENVHVSHLVCIVLLYLMQHVCRTPDSSFLFVKLHGCTWNLGPACSFLETRCVP